MGLTMAKVTNKTRPLLAQGFGMLCQPRWGVLS